jgi:hypothetical protein
MAPRPRVKVVRLAVSSTLPRGVKPVRISAGQWGRGALVRDQQVHVWCDEGRDRL